MDSKVHLLTLVQLDKLYNAKRNSQFRRSVVAEKSNKKETLAMKLVPVDPFTQATTTSVSIAIRKGLLI